MATGKTPPRRPRVGKHTGRNTGMTQSSFGGYATQPPAATPPPAVAPEEPAKVDEAVNEESNQAVQDANKHMKSGEQDSE